MTGVTTGRKLRILLVEDHADTLAMMSRLLGREGHTILAADGYAAALALGQAEAFDVLITDLELRDGTGWALLEQLGDRRPFAAVAVSGHGTDDDVRHSLSRGFCAHLGKPISFDQLLAAVSACEPVRQVSEQR